MDEWWPCWSLFFCGRKKLAFGVRAIDQILLGGIPSGCIAEITGEAGSGKTQTAMHLTAQALVSQLDVPSSGRQPTDAAVYYIYTEGSLPAERLSPIVESSVRRHYASRGVAGGELEERVQHCVGKLMDRIYVEHVEDEGRLSYVLSSKIPLLMSVFKVVLVVIDSIAAIFRVPQRGLNRDGLAARSESLFILASLLKRIAANHSAWVVVTNQVSLAQLPRGFRGDANQSHAMVRPTLGMAWSTCVNCRMMLSKARWSGGREVAPRQFHLEFAPHAHPERCGFRIGNGGIEGVEEA
ncbi:unnamed protein product [Vitrella brassicaformis CCMP3155]|uniref:RecA family profile 1 domain-containing protein n=1 Tax=Vitrella brassicaformis (strain CCMP3155) TaxID=1169540 RepID=A0A0G4EQB6_VITBC|nr:unnamed protein product [Vitrella brassicaformis CCMP3155]|eukprot:CEL99651.1 unnamed protein product [Vitrella brassicaformis CCMP3155]